MNDRQQRTVEAFQRVRIYFDVHPFSPAPPLLVTALADLGNVIDHVEELRATQMSAERDMKPHVDHRRNVLRDRYMKPLARIATGEKFSVVRTLATPHKRANAATIAEAALRMADAFDSWPELIEAAGLPPDHLAAMRREAHDLQLSARRSGTARNRRSLATRELADALKRGMEIVSQIEGLVMIHHGATKEWMGLWKTTRRVQKRKGRPRKRRAEAGERSIPSAMP